MNLGIAITAVKKWWNFVRPNWKPVFKKTLQLEAYELVILIIVGIVAITATVLAMGSASNITLAIAIGLFALAITAILVFVMLSIDSVYYNIMEDTTKKKKTEIMKNFKANLWPVTKYQVTMLLITLITLIPFFLGFMWLVASMMENYTNQGTISTEMIYQKAEAMMHISNAYVIIVGTVIGFFFQFAIFYLIIAKKGAVESIKKSVSLVKNNFFETILFTVFSSIIIFIVAIPYEIALFGLILVGMAMIIAVLNSTVLLIVITAIITIILLVVIAAGSALVNGTSISLHYIYWRLIERK